MQCPRAVPLGEHPAVAPSQVTNRAKKPEAKMVYVSRPRSPATEVGRLLALRLAAAPAVRWALLGPLFQCSWNPQTHLAVLLIDLWSRFGGLVHVFLALGCRCVAVCVERNREAAELALAAFPQSVHVGTVDGSRRRGSSCQSDTSLGPDKA